MKTKMERLIAKRDKLQTKLSRCETQIKEEQRKEQLKSKKTEREYCACDKTKLLIESPFDAGNVYNVNVSVRDTVKKGDVLFVLETLKMEIPILAPNDGTVVQVNASVGDRVCKDDILAVIETW